MFNELPNWSCRFRNPPLLSHIGSRIWSVIGSQKSNWHQELSVYSPLLEWLETPLRAASYFAEGEATDTGHANLSFNLMVATREELSDKFFFVVPQKILYGPLLSDYAQFEDHGFMVFVNRGYPTRTRTFARFLGYFGPSKGNDLHVGEGYIFPTHA